MELRLPQAFKLPLYPQDRCIGHASPAAHSCLMAPKKSSKASRSKAFSRSRSPPESPSLLLVASSTWPQPEPSEGELARSAPIEVHEPSPPASGPSSFNESRIYLPPNVASSESYLEGSIPNVLVDRRLRPNMTPRGESLMSVLSGTSYESRGGAKDEEGTVEEREGLLPPSDETEDGEGHGDNDPAGLAPPRAPHARSRSTQSRAKRLRWFQRASPSWFLPGTFVMSLSIGMIISPKLEIYNQLMCRALVPQSDQSPLGPPPSQPQPFLVLPRAPPAVFPVGGVPDNTTQMIFSFGEKNADGWSKETAEWSRKCRQNPVVQRAVARLATSLVLIMGILAALTTGFWGSLSDRRGRKPIIALALFGTIVMDAVFLIVVNYHHIVGYRFLFLGPAIDGLLGGIATASAAVNAYLSDCTNPGSRARIFSILGGLLFAGIALGPTVGALAISYSGDVLTPFYLALTLHTCYFLFVLAVVPESLAKDRQKVNQRRHEEDVVALRDAEKAENEAARASGLFKVALVKSRRALMKPFGFLRPLKLLMPVKRGERKDDDLPILMSKEVGGSVRGGGGRDWTLVKIGVGFTAFIMNNALISVKIQYTGFKFGWGPTENGYFLSYIGCCRVFVLIIGLPTLIRLFRKKPPTPKGAKPVESDVDFAAKIKEWEKEEKFLKVVCDSHFDLFLARTSLVIEMVGYSFMALNGGSEGRFLMAVAFQSLGGGATPALQSFALAHASARDSGRLFASLSVLSTISSQVVGPLLFGTLYFSTVGFWPESVFWVGVGLFCVSLLAMSLVRLRVWVNDEGDVVLMGNEDEVEGGTAAVSRKVKGKGKGKSGRGDESISRGRSQTRKSGSTLSESGVVIRE